MSKKIKELIRGSIPSNGVKPRKSEVYTLAAEYTEYYKIVEFKKAIYCALLTYDGYYYGYYGYDYGYYSNEEKVIALLFLATIYK